jgi:DNA-binding HxlR family transcriptional regulator
LNCPGREYRSVIETYDSLTAKGEAPSPVFEQLDDWAAEWVDGR